MEQPAQEDIGVVVSTQANRVKVEVERGGGCKSCSLQGMCFSRKTPAVFDLVSEIPLQAGDRVTLEIADATRVMSALLVFAVPLAFLFAGFLIAARFLAELPSIGIAFASMALGFIMVRCIDRRFGKHLQVRIGRKL